MRKSLVCFTLAMSAFASGALGCGSTTTDTADNVTEAQLKEGQCLISYWAGPGEASAKGEAFNALDSIQEAKFFHDLGDEAEQYNGDLGCSGRHDCGLTEQTITFRCPKDASKPPALLTRKIVFSAGVHKGQMLTHAFDEEGEWHMKIERLKK